MAEQQRYECSKCHRDYSNRSNLQYHTKKKHPEDYHRSNARGRPLKVERVQIDDKITQEINQKYPPQYIQLVVQSIEVGEKVLNKPTGLIDSSRLFDCVEQALAECPYLLSFLGPLRTRHPPLALLMERFIQTLTNFVSDRQLLEATFRFAVDVLLARDSSLAKYLPPHLQSDLVPLKRDCLSSYARLLEDYVALKRKELNSGCPQFAEVIGDKDFSF